jgi:coproporphyrinogen III oxidase-like Fe-S oxidoreductase
MEQSEYHKLYIEPLSKDVKRIQDEVDDLYKTIYKGNGSPSLVSQSLKMDNSLKSLQENLDTKIDGLENEMRLRIVEITNLLNEKFKNLEQQITYEFDHRKINKVGSWKFKVAVVSAVTAFITYTLPSFLSHIFHFFKGN